MKRLAMLAAGLATCVIIVLLGLTCLGGRGQPRRDYTLLTMQHIQQRVVVYRIQHGVLPATLDDVFQGDNIPKDPWGNDFRYVVPGPDGHDFDLISYGGDGRPGGEGASQDIRLSEYRHKRSWWPSLSCGMQGA